jgi:uncharacterized protein YbbK (DUF523 family)
MYLVSACLIGVNCRYDGDNNYNEKLYEMFKESLLYPVCPEVLGGLEIPREPCEIITRKSNYKVYDINKVNKTSEFFRGAQKTLKIADLIEVRGVIFKENSPSCGVHYIYDGSFNKNVIEGKGLNTSYLEDVGYKIYSENELDKLEI